MNEYVVVIEQYGFMTSKKESEILDTDEVMNCKGTEQECNDFIHSINPKRYEKKFYDNDSDDTIVNEQRPVATEVRH